MTPAHDIIGTYRETERAIHKVSVKGWFTQEGTMVAPRIDGYGFGEMEVDGELHRGDLILLPDRVIPDWWREHGHELNIHDLKPVLATQPEVLVVGTGAHGAMRVPLETRQALQALGMEVFAATTGEAWTVYNSLSEKRRTAGAFHLTC